MTNLFLFIISTIGMTNIIVHGKIFDTIGLRPWLKKNLNPSLFELLECYECTGFWAGLFTGCILISFNPGIIFLCGCGGSLCSQFYSEVIYLIRSKTGFELNE